MGVEAFLISSSLEGVLAQRLVRRICTECKVESRVSAAVRDRLAALGAPLSQDTFYAGEGCAECRGTGYRGRTGIFELLAVDAEIRESILQKRSSAKLKSIARKHMMTMHEDAMQKAAVGVTSLEEILRVSSGDLLE
jgi:type II secretory ATPase GspE/PulE/Tfp pilus assembly ATPase PilB-like protein